MTDVALMSWLIWVAAPEVSVTWEVTKGAPVCALAVIVCSVMVENSDKRVIEPPAVADELTEIVWLGPLMAALESSEITPPTAAVDSACRSLERVMVPDTLARFAVMSMVPPLPVAPAFAVSAPPLPKVMLPLNSSIVPPVVEEETFIWAPLGILMEAFLSNACILMVPPVIPEASSVFIEPFKGLGGDPP